jgi:hypothetical protein
VYEGIFNRNFTLKSPSLSFSDVKRMALFRFGRWKSGEQM